MIQFAFSFIEIYYIKFLLLQQYNDFDDLLYTYDYNYEDDDAIETTSDNLWADGSNNIET